MKNKVLTITTIVFFLLVNTSYYWESKVGLLALPAFLLVGVVFIILVLCFLDSIRLVIKEKFYDRQRLLIIAMLTITLGLAFFKPNGFVDFEKFEGSDILIAQREGAANWPTIFKLKENNKFTEQNICFGITEIKGDYKLKNDTIFFENVELGRGKTSFTNSQLYNLQNLVRTISVFTW